MENSEIFDKISEEFMLNDKISLPKLYLILFNKDKSNLYSTDKLKKWANENGVKHYTNAYYTYEFTKEEIQKLAKDTNNFTTKIKIDKNYISNTISKGEDVFIDNETLFSSIYVAVKTNYSVQTINKWAREHNFSKTTYGQYIWTYENINDFIYYHRHRNDSYYKHQKRMEKGNYSPFYRSFSSLLPKTLPSILIIFLAIIFFIGIVF